MKVGIAAHASAVVEQPRVVSSDALEARIDRALDLGVGRARTASGRARTLRSDRGSGRDRRPRTGHRGVRPVEHILDAARGGSNSVVMNAARRSRSPKQSGEQRADHVGWHAPEAATNTFRLVAVAQRAADVRRARLAEALAGRGEHQPLAAGPATVDAGLVGPARRATSSSVRRSHPDSSSVGSVARARRRRSAYRAGGPHALPDLIARERPSHGRIELLCPGTERK
jgi:hypothetical protein